MRAVAEGGDVLTFVCRIGVFGGTCPFGGGAGCAGGFDSAVLGRSVAGVATMTGEEDDGAAVGAFGSAASPAAQAYVADRTHLSQRTEELAALTAAMAA